MWFINWIIQELSDASGFFYNAYVEVDGWIWPFWHLGTPLYYLSSIFADLAWDFLDFSDWVSDVQGKVAQILSWSTIWSYILSYIPNLITIRDWFYSWWGNITSVITSWWSTVQYTVLAWVQDAKYLATSLFNQANAWLATLQSAWDNFKGKIPTIDQLISWWGNWWGNILPSLTSWWNNRLLDVLSLINSSFIARDSFWAGWQDMKSNAVEFFTDPVEFIWGRFTDWFLGPEA